MSNHCFKTVGIIAKPNDARVGATLPQLIEVLDKAQVETIIDPVAQGYLQHNGVEVVEASAMVARIELAITIGGDGTLLSAGQSMVNSGVPLIGINLGRLGFLTSISPDLLAEGLGGILNGQYTDESRSVLEASLIRQEQVIQTCLAINDVVIHSREVIRMIELETLIDGQLLNVLRADGLIVSTPTGSTAYALSGGGPIVEPNVPATLLVPICPHTLSNRPIVVNESSRIEVTYSQNNEISALASIDGQLNCDLMPGDCISIYKSDKCLRLIQPTDHSHFFILRKKLGWSSQP